MKYTAQIAYYMYITAYQRDLWTKDFSDDAIHLNNKDRHKHMYIFIL